MKKENEPGCWECKTNELGQTMWEAYKTSQAELRTQVSLAFFVMYAAE